MRNQSKVKLGCMVLLRLGLKGVKYFGKSRNFVCTLFYQMGIPIYVQISIIRIYSKVKLRQAFSLGLGLKVIKIAWNVVKVGVHACLSNGQPNLSSSFNSQNLVKSETPSCGFVRVWLKGVENNSKHLNLRPNFNSKKFVKS